MIKLNEIKFKGATKQGILEASSCCVSREKRGVLPAA